MSTPFKLKKISVESQTVKEPLSLQNNWDIASKIRFTLDNSTFKRQDHSYQDDPASYSNLTGQFHIQKGRITLIKMVQQAIPTSMFSVLGTPEIVFEGTRQNPKTQLANATNKTESELLWCAKQSANQNLQRV